MKSKQVISANVRYIVERYQYDLKFNLENIGQYISYLSYDDIKIENPEYIYKFFGRNKNSLNSLKENYLYFSDPRNFNDPFDCLVNRESFITLNKAYMKQHRDNIGVCSFSVKNDNPLMWGHYGNCFTGFCIKIKNDFSNKKDIAVKSHVAYLEDYNGQSKSLSDAINAVGKLDLENIQKKTIQNILQIAYQYCWKFYDWKYENEYRIISINSLDYERKLKFENSQITEIYIGWKMKINYPAYYKRLLQIIKKYYSHIIVYEVKPHPIKVKLEFIKT